MKSSDKYLKIVEWSEEDDCYVGTCPGLMLGKVYSGKFLPRPGEKLHKKLAVQALCVGESLNSYCVNLLQDRSAGKSGRTKPIQKVLDHVPN